MRLAGLKVLFLVPEDHYFVSHRLSFAKMLMQHGAQVHLLTKLSTFVDELQQAGVHVHEWGYERAALGVRAQIFAVRRLNKCVKAVQPDLIHTVALKPALYCGVFKAVTRNFIPTVNAIAGLGSAFVVRPGLRNRWARTGLLFGLRVALRQKKVLAAVQNAGDGEQLSRLGVAADRVVVVGGVGVDLEQFPGSDEPRGEAPVVMFVSRLLRDKGIVEFMDAARDLRASGLNARFVVVGKSDPGNPSSVTEEQVSAWQAEDVAEFWGFQRDVSACLRQASIVCLPSYSEGTPKVLLEAAASGRPAVATNVPGCAGVVDDGMTGILVPPRDSASLAAAIDDLISNSGRRQAMGRAAREKAERSFAVESANARVLELYDQLLQVRTELAAAQVAR